MGSRRRLCWHSCRLSTAVPAIENLPLRSSEWRLLGPGGPKKGAYKGDYNGSRTANGRSGHSESSMTVRRLAVPEASERNLRNTWRLCCVRTADGHSGRLVSFLLIMGAFWVLRRPKKVQL